jgi:hypothetical protein
MVTISQIKVWDCILVAQPIKTSFEFQQMALKQLSIIEQP